MAIIAPLGLNGIQCYMVLWLYSGVIQGLPSIIQVTSTYKKNLSGSHNGFGWEKPKAQNSELSKICLRPPPYIPQRIYDKAEWTILSDEILKYFIA